MPPLHTHTPISLSHVSLTSLGRDVPVILSALGNAYYSQNGPTEEGIFRLSGNERETAELEKQLNYIPAYISANASIHSIATLIKVPTLSYPSICSLSLTHTHTPHNIHSLTHCSLSLSLSGGSVVCLCTSSMRWTMRTMRRAAAEMSAWSEPSLMASESRTNRPLSGK